MGQAEIWDDLVGDAWVRNAEAIDRHGHAFGEAAADALGDLRGRRILDVGCGTGDTTRALARRGAAEVVGVDLSTRMVDHARSTTTDPGVSFLAADVDTLDEPASFDAIFSRFGVMFFEDPVASFGHLRSLLRPDGQLAFACWQGPFENPWMATAVVASIPLLGPPRLPGPGEPGPFSLADPEVIRDVLGAAGWRDVAVEPITTEDPHPGGDPDGVARLVVGQAPPLALGLAERPEVAEELHAAIVEALQPFVRPEGVVLPAAGLIVTARAGA